MSSANTRKQRNYIYQISFMKWTQEQRIEALQEAIADCNISVLKFRKVQDIDNYKKVIEHISDLETMIEVSEMYFPSGFRNDVEEMKKKKLVLLKKHTKLQNEADKKKQEAENLEEEKEEATQIEMKKETKKEKGFFKTYLSWL